MFDSDVRLVEAVNAALAAFDSLAAQLEAAQREAQENFEAMMEERDRAIAAQKEYGLRAAKRQLKKDNASLVEQNLALRSKVSVLAAQLESEKAKLLTVEAELQLAQKVIGAARSANVWLQENAEWPKETALDLALARYDARDLPSSQQQGHTEAS